MKTRLIGKL